MLKKLMKGRAILRLISGLAFLFGALSFNAFGQCSGEFRGTVINLTAHVQSTMSLTFDSSGEWGYIKIEPPLAGSSPFTTAQSRDGTLLLQTRESGLGNSIDWKIHECDMNAGILRGRYAVLMQFGPGYSQAGEFDLRTVSTGRSDGRTSNGKNSTPQLAATGSGWAVSPKHLVTNAHVIDGCSKVVTQDRGEAQVIALDRNTDLALLTVSRNPVVATLRSGRIRQGEAVTVVGYPLTGMLANGAIVTTGIVSALAGLENNTNLFQISAPVQPGNSGGPLLDSSGNVIAVVNSKLNALKVARATGNIPENINFAVSLSALKGFLDANEISYMTAPREKLLSTADVTDLAKKFTVLLSCYE